MPFNNETLLDIIIGRGMPEGKLNLDFICFISIWKKKDSITVMSSIINK